MNGITSFQENILKCVDLSPEELDQFTSRYRVMEVAKNEMILEEGKVCKLEGYVLAGCFKIFYVDDNGREHILK